MSNSQQPKVTGTVRSKNPLKGAVEVLPVSAPLFLLGLRWQRYRGVMIIIMEFYRMVAILVFFPEFLWSSSYLPTAADGC